LLDKKYLRPNPMMKLFATWENQQTLNNHWKHINEYYECR
jgi:hypothetical protein